MTTRQARGARSGLKRKLIWVGFTLTAGSLAAGATTFGSALDVRNQSQLHGATIVRIRGEWAVQPVSTVSLTAGAPTRFVQGMMIVQGEARDAGASSMPNPDADTDASWMWFKDMLGAAIGSNEMSNGVWSGSIDVRAQRKLQPNTVLAYLGVNQTSVICHVAVAGRILIKLP